MNRFQNRLTWSAVLSFIVVAGLVAACSSASPAASGAAASASTSASAAASASAAVLPSLDSSTLDTNTVLSADVAASIIGGTPTVQPGSINSGPMSLLSYANATGDDVTILVETVPLGLAQTVLQAAIQNQGATGEMQPVSGLGDAAGKTVTDHDATIAFVKSNTLVLLTASASAMAGTDLDPKLEALAQQIAGKL